MGDKNYGIQITGGAAQFGNAAVGPDAKIINNSTDNSPTTDRTTKDEMRANIAIITIREDELQAVLDRFETKRLCVPSGRHYEMSHIVTSGDRHFTIAITRCSEQGNDMAQTVAHNLIDDLKPQLILVVGIAGGVPTHEFTLGDVIVSTYIQNVNVGKANPDGTYEFVARGGSHPLIAEITSLLPGDTRLRGWNWPASITQERPELDFRQISFEGADDWRKQVQESLHWHFETGQNRYRLPIFKTGHIASSNILQCNPEILKLILKTDRATLAVEMESAGIYQAAQKSQASYPVLAIRGISDIVGLSRDERWTAYACQTAASFARAFIMTEPV